MDELEDKLSAMRLAAPSADLDRRMEQTFSAARKTAERSHRIGPWRWLVGAAMAGSVAALVIVSLRPSLPVPAPAVYRVEAAGLWREMLLNPVAHGDQFGRRMNRVDQP